MFTTGVQRFAICAGRFERFARLLCDCRHISSSFRNFVRPLTRAHRVVRMVSLLHHLLLRADHLSVDHAADRQD
jgi:hypothetical protein